MVFVGRAAFGLQSKGEWRTLLFVVGIWSVCVSTGNSLPEHHSLHARMIVLRVQASEEFVGRFSGGILALLTYKSC
jgi:hypothetical protein